MKIFVAFLSFFVLMLVAIPMYAQTQTTESKGLELLTPDVTVINGVKYIAVNDIDNYMLANNQKIGWGKEVGEAINQGLSAVVGVAGEFSETNVGKFTMILIAWKVMGKDVVRIFLGLVFLAIITWLFVKVYKNTYIPKRVMVENPGFMKYPKKYEIIRPERWEGYELVKILLLFLYAGAVGISYAIMFAQ